MIKNVKRYKIIIFMRIDLQWWHEFLLKWNDIKLLRIIASRSISHIWIDVLNNWNMKNLWLTSSIDKSYDVFSVRFSTRYKEVHDIQIKKMQTMSHVITLWLNRLRSFKLVIHCDNQIVYFDLTKDVIRDFVMIFLRHIVMF